VGILLTPAFGIDFSSNISCLINPCKSISRSVAVYFRYELEISFRDSLTVSPDTFISNELKLTESDVLYAATLFDTPAYIYILSEHQRNPDPLMPFRLLEYTVAIIRKYLHQHPSETLLPLVIPLVFYNGEKPYPYATDIKEIMAAPGGYRLYFDSH
jgi:predicted transposase/invertase (TIGR01784 family)